MIFFCAWRGMKNSHSSNRKPGEKSSSAMWSRVASCYIPGIALGCKQSSSRGRPCCIYLRYHSKLVEHMKNLAIVVKSILIQQNVSICWMCQTFTKLSQVSTTFLRQEECINNDILCILCSKQSILWFIALPYWKACLKGK